MKVLLRRSHLSEDVKEAGEVKEPAVSGTRTPHARDMSTEALILPLFCRNPKLSLAQGYPVHTHGLDCWFKPRLAFVEACTLSTSLLKGDFSSS